MLFVVEDLFCMYLHICVLQITSYARFAERKMLAIRRAVLLDKISGYRLTDFGLGFTRRFLNDDLNNQPAITSSERARSVTAFYFQVAIDNAAKKVLNKVKYDNLIYGYTSYFTSHGSLSSAGMAFL